MFRTLSVRLEHSDLRVFIGGDPIDGYTWTADLAAALDMQAPSIRSQISKHGLKKLVDIPELRDYLITEEIVSGGKLRFASSVTWGALVRPRVSPDTWTSVDTTLRHALEAGVGHGNVNSGNDSGNDSGNKNDSDKVESTFSEAQLAQLGEMSAPEASAAEIQDNYDAMDISDLEIVAEGGDDDHRDVDVAGNCSDDAGSDVDDENEVNFDGDVPKDDDDDLNGGEQNGDSNEGSDSNDSDNESGNNSDDSDGSDSSSSSSGADESILPLDIPAWVLNDVDIPSQFSVKDYSKSFSLKSYDMQRTLKKDLKKLAKWWMKPRNSERIGKVIQQNTASKREERVLCFLGFVLTYQCLPENHDLCLGLFLNHKLFGAYIEYLQKVRQNAAGTIAEAITAAVYVCKWLYRKNPAGSSQIIRRYKDWRNTFQNQAIRVRKQEDKDDLKDQNKWIGELLVFTLQVETYNTSDWSEFTSLVGKLRREWTSIDVLDRIGPKEARTLHDLLLLGLYSCVPARGAEVRLLEYVPDHELVVLQGKLTLKKFVEKRQMNLITHIDGTWKMVLSQYKNFRTNGIDCTDVTQFDWWTKLFVKYVKVYRPLIVGQNDHRFVFVTRHGEPFTYSYFSDFISSLLCKFTGKRVATNLLRSSFVTHFYNTSEANDPVMCESIASIMRHSVAEARKTYDRRTSTQRKRKGLDLLAKLSGNPLDVGDVGEAEENNAEVGGEKRRSIERNIAVEPEAEGPIVVLFKRVPHKVIRIEGESYVVAKMQRSMVSNAPTYYVPPEAIFVSKPKAECSPVAGHWMEDEFTIQ